MNQAARLPSRQYEIDLLRFLAALMVVVYHYTFRAYGEDNLSPIAYPALGRLTRYGYLGVQLFFIISGYVVLLSAQGKTVREFFVSRVQRLYPAYWIAVTLTFLIVRIGGTGPDDVLSAPLLYARVHEYLVNLTMLQEFLGVDHIDQAYWSLTVELSFYFIIALLLAYKLMPRLNLVVGLWLAYAAAAPYLNGFDEAFTHLLFPQYAPFFIAGMLFYLMQQPAGRSRVRYGLLLAAYGLALRNCRYGTVAHGTQNELVMVVTTGFFLVIGLVAFGKLNLGSRPWLARLGALTYPLYLLHGHIGYVVFHRLGHLLNKYVLLACLLGLMLLAAYLVSTRLEKPISQFIRRRINDLLDYVGKPARATPRKVLSR